MSDPAATLTSLLRASSIEDHDQVLKAANAAIKASKTDLRAQNTRVVALLKLDRFDDALRALAEGGDPLEKECLLEKAYALYKTGELEDAQKIVRSAANGSPSRALRHLAAQIAYRAEDFKFAADSYRHLSEQQNGIAGEENDVKINTLAVNAQLAWNGLGHLNSGNTQPSREDLEAFETAYNAACGFIARADFAKADILLKRARDLCDASDELSADEKLAELLPIMVQHTYVLTRLGKHDQAAALQKSIQITEIPEAPTRAVAQNNQIAIGDGEKNPYLTQRIIASAATLSNNDKLFEYQASVLRRNRYALDLEAQKFDGVETAAAKKINEQAGPTASVEIANLGVISAAARTQLETGKAALKKILPMLEKRPTDIGLLLTIIQLYVQTKNPGPAVTLLETFLKRLEVATTPNHDDVRFAPGLVAAAVALYQIQGRHNSIRTELSKASAHWRSKEDSSSVSLLRESGVELLRSPNPEDVAAAGATFEKLVAQSKNDPTAVAGLIASFAASDYAKVEPHLSSLTAVERLTAGIDVQSLVHGGVASIPASAPPPTSKKRPADGDAGADNKAAKKRRHKIRLPKNYEEGKQPDPERWLPLRDRSTWRPKGGKKGKKRAQDTTQGGVVKEEETLELVGGAGAVKVEKATGGQGGNKKKKKGKK